jgi:RIO kinase 1
MSSLDLLLADGVIEEVVSRLKSGKEADVYLVQHRGEIVAAKLYKERHARNFHNNAAYREGRTVRNSRTQRAMDKGSRFGQAAAEEAWKSTESDALYRLHAAGMRVPQPVLFYEGILLMEVVVDAEGHPAPRLIDAHVPLEVAAPFYADLRAQVVKMLTCDLIHGDLSPYNVLLAWNGPTIIDFPQVVGAAHNQQAASFFERDLRTLHRFFAAVDPSLNAHASDAQKIWRAYERRELTPDFVPSPGEAKPLKVRAPHSQRTPQGPGRGRDSRRDGPPADVTFRGHPGQEPGRTGSLPAATGGARTSANDRGPRADPRQGGAPPHASGRSDRQEPRQSGAHPNANARSDRPDARQGGAHPNPNARADRPDPRHGGAHPNPNARSDRTDARPGGAHPTANARSDRTDARHGSANANVRSDRTDARHGGANANVRSDRTDVRHGGANANARSDRPDPRHGGANANARSDRPDARHGGAHPNANANARSDRPDARHGANANARSERPDARHGDAHPNANARGQRTDLRPGPQGGAATPPREGRQPRGDRKGPLVSYVGATPPPGGAPAGPPASPAARSPRRRHRRGPPARNNDPPR